MKPLSASEMHRGRVMIVVLALFVTASGGAWADDFDHEPINYGKSPADNAVTRLQARLDAGQTRLIHEEHFGYLRSLLKELQVPESSQMLVFSKTSLQRDRIAPRTPRSLYFNDESYVGFCQHGNVLELSAVDPQLGTVFYTLDQDASPNPKFRRQGDACLICHGSSQTQGVPGHLVRSVFPDPAGLPLLSEGTYRIDHTSPLKQRWGGWYVTGKHGEQTHLGNLIIRDRHVTEPVDNAAGLNLTDLRNRLNPANYLTPHSDIVALMVLEHQTQGHNLLTRASFLTRQALYHEATLNRELGQPADHRWESTTSRIRSAGDPLVKYLLMADEAALTGKIEGTSAFAKEFVSNGPSDRRGRSLRELDLERRLFKYPCSYLIYSPSFDALPAAVRDYVLKKMWLVLTGRDTSQDFSHLSPEDCEAILQILQATKPNLPEYWRKGMAAK